MSKANPTGRRQVLRCIGCGAVHPDNRPPQIPGEVTACGDCWERAENDGAFDVLLALALASNVPLNLPPKPAPGVH